MTIDINSITIPVNGAQQASNVVSAPEADSDGKVSFSITGPEKFTEWLSANLTAEDQAKYFEIADARKALVEAAVANGDCEIVTVDSNTTRIVWKDAEVQFSAIAQQIDPVQLDFYRKVWYAYTEANPA